MGWERATSSSIRENFTDKEKKRPLSNRFRSRHRVEEIAEMNRLEVIQE